MRFEDLRVSDLMSTALLTVRETDSVRSALEEMHIANIRHLPVVDERHHVVGIVSNRDLFKAARGKKDVPVGQVMSRHILFVSPEEDAAHAASLMLEHKIGSLPVVGEEQQIVGVVTETDFLDVAYRALSGLSLER